MPFTRTRNSTPCGQRSRNFPASNHDTDSILFDTTPQAPQPLNKVKGAHDKVQMQQEPSSHPSIHSRIGGNVQIRQPWATDVFSCSIPHSWDQLSPRSVLTPPLAQGSGD
jgi:hypothetical protein